MSTLKVNQITDLNDAEIFEPNLMTAVSASGTSVDFTGIPSWVKRITVMFSGVSTSGTSNYLIQIGDSGGIENTGYVATAMAAQGASTSVVATSTAGFIVTGNVQANTQTQFGAVVINKFNGNTFVSSGTIVDASTRGNVSGGNKTLSDTLTQVRITTVNGTDTFDAGTINVMYE